MKVKAIWKSKNPFNPDINQLRYSKTVNVPDDTDMEELEKHAKNDSQEGYVFDKFEPIKQ